MKMNKKHMQGTAAKLAKETVEQKQNEELQKKIEVQKEQVEKVFEKKSLGNIKKVPATKVQGAIVVPSSKDVKIYTAGTLMDKFREEKNHYVTALLNENFEVERMMFGWVKFPNGQIVPSYELQVYEDKERYYLLPKSVAYTGQSLYAIEDCTPIHYGGDIQVTKEASFSSVIGFDGNYFIPGKDAMFSVDKVGSTLRNIGNINIVRTFAGYGDDSSDKIVTYILMEDYHTPVEVQMSDLMGISNFIPENSKDNVEYTFEFSEETEDVMWGYLKAELNGRTYMVPQDMLGTVKQISAQIENNTVTANQLKKLGELIKVKFSMVLTTSICNTALVKIPKYSDKTQELYENLVDILEEEYKVLENGIEIPVEEYGFEEVYNHLQSGKYSATDIQFVVDYYRANKN